MAALIASPDWFRGVDILLEVFTMLAALAVVYAGAHAYKVTKQRKHLYFAAAFGILALSFAARLFTAATIIFEEFRQGIVTPALAMTGVGWDAFSLGRLGYVWFVLAAYAILLGLSMHWTRKREFLAVIGLTTIIAATSIVASWPFYLASLVLLFSIAMQHGLNYAATRSQASLRIFGAFAFLTLEPLLYILSFVDPAMIAAAYMIRLLAYLFVLVTIWRVFR